MADYTDTDNQINDTDSRLDKLARDVLSLSANTLLVNLRFMDEALSRLTPAAREGSLSTDGEHLFYDARFVLKRYMTEKELPVRDYLHTVLHCVFRHNFEADPLEQKYWNLACDMAVENVVCELNVKAAAAARQAAQREELEIMRGKAGKLTAEKIYQQLQRENLPPEEIARLSALFIADDHGLWYSEENSDNSGGNERQQEEQQDQERQNEQQENEQQEREQQSESRDRDSEQKKPQPAGEKPRESAEADWKEIAERMQVDMETFSRSRGETSENLVQNLRAVNRERYDYTSFLRKFSVMGEAMKINDDEFDYIFYTYGLRIYDKMPLIEPLEYKEEKRIREFVIALDTSGSVQGELVQKFIEKTYNILMQTESFFKKINLHIIQCDAQIQEDVKITSREEFDEYIKNMNLLGFGGTDFRPVFTYVEQLRKEKEFTNLKGLIYFTDGDGTFPQQMPDYPTAFVFVDNDDEPPQVPPWAIRLVLRPNEI